ncbi:hypothetical protein [Oceanicaulis alexandrii]|uniref:hypothetical protein n=1 Tax=Oceanicaulis alexandrii TaxID=153233 RepID=UPI003B51231C
MSAPVIYVDEGPTAEACKGMVKLTITSGGKELPFMLTLNAALRLYQAAHAASVDVLKSQSAEVANGHFGDRGKLGRNV